LGVTPQKSPTSGFRGSEFLPLLVVHDVAHKNWGSNSRMANGVLPPNPKNPKNCVGDLAISGEQIWTKLQIYTLQISGRPPISFWEKSDEGVSKKWGVKNWGVGHFWGLPPFGARTHQATHASYSAGDSEKNGFYLGGIGPHLGEIWGF